jgi:hypothetical protein
MLNVTRVARWFVFKPKNSNLGKFWSALERKMLVYFVVIWNIRLFGKFYGHFGIVVVIWYIFPRFGILCQEKSGNPECYPHPHHPVSPTLRRNLIKIRIRLS